MEATVEGLQASAETRQALKRRREELISTESSVKARAIPVLKHHVEIPEGFDVDSIKLDVGKYGSLHNPEWNGEMAKQFNFKLDPFQQAAISCLERRESVLVAAHTSAGKTAVAEYAIAMSSRDRNRVIYTSPLKALSNQKYRELAEEFGDVGLMTGDVTLNPTAACVVMTTEILRSMLYRGGEVLREVAWVVFDEVHYMQDRERGVVWEESIIFLPHQAHMVFLSATLANASEFAAWVASLHRQPCHIVYTDYRPTMLQHYAFPVGGNGIYSIKDGKGVFKTDVFAKLRLEGFGIVEEEDGQTAVVGASSKAGAVSKKNASSDVHRVLKLVKEKHLEPVIVFSFSRRDCEQHARMTARGVSFNSDEEAAEVEEVFSAAVQCLAEEDRQLSPITSLLPMLKRGIGVHHSGLLPILKEVVELLFQTQLVKCLFATETFAMGLNMPAKTVIFTAVRKWDGTETRALTSGEYVQMSGRAGRRGMDDFGVVVMMVDDKMTTEACRQMVSGVPSSLMSSFKLSYYTLLNLLRRVEGSEYDMEFVISHSFQQFQFDRQLPLVEKQLKDCEERIKQLTGGDVSNSAEDDNGTQYHQILERIAEQETILTQAMLQPHKIVHMLRPGRLVKVREGATDFGWGVLVCLTMSHPPKAAKGAKSGTPAGCEYTLDVLLPCAEGSLSRGAPQPGWHTEGDVEMHVIPVPLRLVTGVSSMRVVLPTDLVAREPRQAVFLTLKEVVAKHPDGIPRLDPVEDLGLGDDPDLVSAAHAITALEQQLATCRPPRPDEAEVAKQVAVLKSEAAVLRHRMKSSQLTGFREEVKARMAVLEKLGHVDKDGLVTLKGRAACEIDTADELVTLELMVNGVFSSLDAHQLVALVSCLVPSDKSDQEVELVRQLGGPLEQLQCTAYSIGEIQQEAGLAIEPQEFSDSFKPYLIDVIYQWSKGATFEHICTLTTSFEGSIIRATRRLDELMSQLQIAARVLGDEALAKLFEDGASSIRRDIMFAASLFV